MEDCNERPFLFWSGSHFVRIFALFLVPERKQEGISGTVPLPIITRRGTGSGVAAHFQVET
jgi:hypothetical protein